MIIRKPYAFLIKNFRKIHIFLLILSFYVAYKLLDISKFINEFMRLGTYDLYADPVSKHITGLLSFSVLLIVFGGIALLFLLRHKGKPWKIYLVPIIEYFLLFLILNVIKSFFANFSDDVEVTDLRFARDMLLFFMIGQLPAIGIFIMRVFGLDIKKFNFNSDQEFLELSDEDREEVEISLSFDFNTIKRLYKKLIRNIGYFYKEHKIICRVAIGIIAVILLKNAYTFIFVTNRTYKAGQLYNANGYTIRVGNSYYTDKDYKGEVISDKSSFVIVEMYVKNNSAPRNLKIDNFHLRNRKEDYVSSHKTYADEFYDLGKTYESVKELKRDEELSFIIVYKVEKKLPKNGFVMYYQELGGDNKLRKIKLNVKDISKVNDSGTVQFGDTIDININGVEDSISIDRFDFIDSFLYKVSKCSSSGCEYDDKDYFVSEGYKVLKISFGSLVYESKDMKKFISKYGKIVYTDEEDNEREYEIKYAINSEYYGKYLYLLVPEDVANAKTINLLLLLRNNKYVYKLK